jgi:ABC-2 type transport system permease protein
MWSICQKELRQFFSSLTGFVAVLLFLLLSGLLLFVFPDTNVFDEGYASMDVFFQMAPWILLLLIPAVTMRSFSEEFRSGTYELLRTRPLTTLQLVTGKYLAALCVVVLSILPTLVFFWTIDHLSAGGTDRGGIIGSYIGLFFLSAAFTAAGICCSSFTSNAVLSFLVSSFVCYVGYYAFEALSRLTLFEGGPDYYVELLGMELHYRSLSGGVVDMRDLSYFISVVLLFLFITARNLVRR